MIKPGSIRLDQQSRIWVNLKWGKIRKAQQAADKANNDWHAMNDKMNAWMDEMGFRDPVDRARRKGENLKLQEALSAGKWHAAEAQRHIDDVNLFLRLKELEIL